MKKGKNIIMLGLICVLSGIFVYFWSGSTSPVISNFYGDDSAMFQIIGKAWCDGKIPYVDTFDHKGPFIFLINALGSSMGNIWYAGGPRAVYEFDVLGNL